MNPTHTALHWRVLPTVSIVPQSSGPGRYVGSNTLIHGRLFCIINILFSRWITGVAFQWTCFNVSKWEAFSRCLCYPYALQIPSGRLSASSFAKHAPRMNRVGPLRCLKLSLKGSSMLKWKRAKELKIIKENKTNQNNKQANKLKKKKLG